MSDLDQLARIHTTRVARLRRAERKAVAKANRCRKDVEAAREDLDQFRDEIANLEFDLLAELVGQEITPQTIHVLKKKLKDAEEKARSLVEEFEDAKKMLDEAETEAGQVHIERKTAQGKQERAQILIEEIQAEDRQETVLANDRELDEIADVLNAITSKSES